MFQPNETDLSGTVQQSIKLPDRNPNRATEPDHSQLSGVDHPPHRLVTDTERLREFANGESLAQHCPYSDSPASIGPLGSSVDLVGPHLR